MSNELGRQHGHPPSHQTVPLALHTTMTVDVKVTATLLGGIPGWDAEKIKAHYERADTAQLIETIGYHGYMLGEAPSGGQTVTLVLVGPTPENIVARLRMNQIDLVRFADALNRLIELRKLR